MFKKTENPSTGTELEEVKKEWMILNCRVRLDGLTVANPFKTSSMRNPLGELYLSKVTGGFIFKQSSY